MSNDSSRPTRAAPDIKADPVTAEILRNSLRSIAQFITRRMIRSANSFIVKEMEDCSAAILDSRGRLLAEESGPPIQLNTVGICLKTILQDYLPLNQWNPGDVVITNDPYLGGGSLGATHTNDYIAFSPIFFGDSVIAFSGLMVHHMDVGGMNMATRGWGKEIFQEGLRIPPLKVVQGGRFDESMVQIILNNTRTREVLENDLRAQISSVSIAQGDVKALIERYGLEQTLVCFDELIRQSEQMTREQIRTIPDGCYRHEEPVLDDGAHGGPYYLRLEITKSGGDLHFDFTGTDPQIKGPINSPLSTTLAAVYYAARCITGSSIPSTEGCKEPIRVTAPSGTLVNAAFPAPVYQRMVVCHSIVDLVFGAFSQAIPEKVMADSCGCMYNFANALLPGSVQRVTFGEVVPGGLGATARADGANVAACHVTNCHIPPIESMEMETPVLYLARELRVDSAGDGQFRGGVGQRLVYQVLGEDPTLNHTAQKSVSLPQGIAGGLPGDGGRWVINEGLPGERTLPQAIGDVVALHTGDTVTHYTPGGGGYGAPELRSPQAVRRDVEQGLLSPEKARRVYGMQF
ncbi:hydantoinase B/oxoprolinase family protein [Bordetella sp. BOR01]|uniref:hydantoinase B/oxoprolinase family protein n=1 Tax=Bordetella sp. BOR01 TaxID=2854779 RepID=UPI001C4819CD|nr:hydantoinase B/oxoprolinase family protein [Bordetella sp. BOR01]MBV7483171.1 hydantoinase B/oxoprolinase family protein [Bordetella sp. BOR01]